MQVGVLGKFCASLRCNFCVQEEQQAMVKFHYEGTQSVHSLQGLMLKSIGM